MFFFRKKRNKLSDAQKEREIQAIREDMFETIDKVVESADKVKQELEKDGGVTELIFLATGGPYRGGKKKNG